MNQYKVKNCSLKIEDISEKDNTVKGYFAAFDNVDSDNEMFVKGSFAKSIKERGVNGSSSRRIAHLRHHDWTKVIGNIQELKEDNRGLLFVSKLGRNDDAKNALLDYQDGLIREHSVGFMKVEGKNEKPQGADHTILKEVILYEGSAVLFGANELTPVLDVSKSENIINAIDKINLEMQSFINALKNGKGTDERLYNIEMGLKVCQAKYNSLIEQLQKPSIIDTLEVIEPRNEVDKRKQLFLNLIKI